MILTGDKEYYKGIGAISYEGEGLIIPFHLSTIIQNKLLWEKQ